MPKIQVWTEGYAATGEHSPASLMGEYEAENFEDAVEKMLADYEIERWKDIRQYYVFRPDHPISKHTIWACRLFDNEADARKAFG